ncbi:MAG TPA: glycoside hydrolase family 15 protein [Vicinamibacteria bacterium]|nr:glycoside hydrolase family 15 protein [Vicinamibacteria bacterium]
MAYLPIERHGIIGNTSTAALVGMNGTIDWYCHPRFDSPSVFAAILDDQKGGEFAIAPVATHVAEKQFYWPDTNVLVTRFLSPDGVGQITDFMPHGLREDEAAGWLVRRVTVSRGAMRFRLRCRPAFDYGRATHRTERTRGGVRFHGPQLSLELSSDPAVEERDGAAVAEFRLDEGQGISFVLRPVQEGAGEKDPVTDEVAERLFRATVEFWRRWLARCTYRGRWRESVHRSALVLKLLTYQPTGAMVAAATCSLPEDLGGVRNWDYRYMWIRDAAMTVYALMKIGFTEEAGEFMDWLSERCRELPPDGTLQIMYSISGEPMRSEEVLPHLAGYRGSSPVRIGNGAQQQLQLDIYGELMDSVYLYDKHGSPISSDLWKHLRRLTNWVCEHWPETDEGIWEVRGGRRHFVHSKLMCWVAIDRALRLAHHRALPADVLRWMEARDAIYEAIMEQGWSEERQAFAQSFGGQSLDAAVLTMPLVNFISPTDRRMLATLDAIARSPKHGGLSSDSLVHRYNVARSPDGIVGDEGTFNICTFWLVEALVRAAGRSHGQRLRDARLTFEQMLGYANHLGLYAEETGPTGEALGNFPQAFTHLGLITAAINLDHALGESEHEA